jgi:ATP-dependent Clp protease ATP-binding subunit ClpA
MFDRFTDQAREVVVVAQEEAIAAGHPWLGTEHLLVAMLRGEEDVPAEALGSLGVTSENIRADLMDAVGTPDRPTAGPLDRRALETIGIDVEEIRRRLEDSFGPGALEGTKAWKEMRCLRLDPTTKKVLQVALREAIRLGEKRVRPEHILLAIVRVQDCLAAQLLAKRVPLWLLREAVTERIRRTA